MKTTAFLRLCTSLGAAFFVAQHANAAAAPVSTLTVKIEEWNTADGAHPHDPEIAADGSAWYAAERENVVGHLDPKTGTAKNYTAPTTRSNPHSLVADKAGNIWYTAGGAALIGKLEPATGKFTEYKMPDPVARDPHALIFDRKGMLWFTVQSGNAYGRIDPATGKVDLKIYPTARALPYGIVVDSKDIPYFSLYGTNKIARIDPATLATTELELPAAARPRKIAITPNDILWYADYDRGVLGRVDPKTKQVREFPTPGGSAAKPYGIIATADGVWLSESGVTPNTLLFFDPAAEKFQSWTIPSGGGTIRHMVASPDGRTLWLACSDLGKMARVTITRAGK